MTQIRFSAIAAVSTDHTINTNFRIASLELDVMITFIGTFALLVIIVLSCFCNVLSPLCPDTVYLVYDISLSAASHLTRKRWLQKLARRRSQTAQLLRRLQAMTAAR